MRSLIHPAWADEAGVKSSASAEWPHQSARSLRRRVLLQGYLPPHSLEGSPSFSGPPTFVPCCHVTHERFAAALHPGCSSSAPKVYAAPLPLQLAPSSHRAISITPPEAAAFAHLLSPPRYAVRPPPA